MKKFKKWEISNMKKVKADYNNYQKREIIYQNNYTKILWECLIKGMKSKVKASLEFKMKIDICLIKLLNAIKEHAISY
jgi:hypothetical protein